MQENGYTYVLTSLGARIREKREGENLSLRKLAAMTGVSCSTIWRLENGLARDPGMETIYKLSVGLQVDFSEFFR